LNQSLAERGNPYRNAGNAGIVSLDFHAGMGMRPIEFKGGAKDAVRKTSDLK